MEGKYSSNFNIIDDEILREMKESLKKDFSWVDEKISEPKEGNSGARKRKRGQEQQEGEEKSEEEEEEEEEVKESDIITDLTPNSVFKEITEDIIKVLLESRKTKMGVKSGTIRKDIQCFTRKRLQEQSIEYEPNTRGHRSCKSNNKCLFHKVIADSRFYKKEVEEDGKKFIGKSIDISETEDPKGGYGLCLLCTMYMVNILVAKGTDFSGRETNVVNDFEISVNTQGEFCTDDVMTNGMLSGPFPIFTYRYLKAGYFNKKTREFCLGKVPCDLSMDDYQISVILTYPFFHKGGSLAWLGTTLIPKNLYIPTSSGASLLPQLYSTIFQKKESNPLPSNLEFLLQPFGVCRMEVLKNKFPSTFLDSSIISNCVIAYPILTPIPNPNQGSDFYQELFFNFENQTSGFSLSLLHTYHPLPLSDPKICAENSIYFTSVAQVNIAYYLIKKIKKGDAGNSTLLQPLHNLIDTHLRLFKLIGSYYDINKKIPNDHEIVSSPQWYLADPENITLPALPNPRFVSDFRVVTNPFYESSKSQDKEGAPGSKAIKSLASYCLKTFLCDPAGSYEICHDFLFYYELVHRMTKKGSLTRQEIVLSKEMELLCRKASFLLDDHDESLYSPATLPDFSPLLICALCPFLQFLQGRHCNRLPIDEIIIDSLVKPKQGHMLRTGGLSVDSLVFNGRSKHKIYSLNNYTDEKILGMTETAKYFFLEIFNSFLNILESGKGDINKLFPSGLILPQDFETNVFLITLTHMYSSGILTGDLKSPEEILINFNKIKHGVQVHSKIDIFIALALYIDLLCEFYPQIEEYIAIKFINFREVIELLLKKERKTSKDIIEVFSDNLQIKRSAQLCFDMIDNATDDIRTNRDFVYEDLQYSGEVVRETSEKIMGEYREGGISIISCITKYLSTHTRIQKIFLTLIKLLNKKPVTVSTSHGIFYQLRQMIYKCCGFPQNIRKITIRHMQENQNGILQILFLRGVITHIKGLLSFAKVVKPRIINNPITPTERWIINALHDASPNKTPLAIFNPSVGTLAKIYLCQGAINVTLDPFNGDYPITSNTKKRSKEDYRSANGMIYSEINETVNLEIHQICFFSKEGLSMVTTTIPKKTLDVTVSRMYNELKTRFSEDDQTDLPWPRRALPFFNDNQIYTIETTFHSIGLCIYCGSFTNMNRISYGPWKHSWCGFCPLPDAIQSDEPFCFRCKCKILPNFLRKPITKKIQNLQTTTMHKLKDFLFLFDPITKEYHKTYICETCYGLLKIENLKKLNEEATEADLLPHFKRTDMYYFH